MAAETLIDTSGLLAFLGAGEESAALVDSLRASALDGIRRATGVDWTAGGAKTGVVNEAVRAAVWMSFYGLRDPSVKTDHLTAYLGRLITQLQYGEEADADGSAEGKATNSGAV